MLFRKGSSLQEMCLNVIVDNWNRFLISSKARGREMDFLRKVYSDELFVMFKKRDKLLYDYADWLLTPYWKKVTLCIAYKFSDIENILVSRLKVMGTAITYLNLENSMCSVDILKAMICCVPNVTYLNLSNTLCDNDSLKLIRTLCTSLSYLNLAGCHSLTDEGMQNLCNLTKPNHGYSSLKTLLILRTKVSFEGISCILQHITSLECLRVENLPFLIFNLDKSGKTQPIYNLTHFEHNWNTPLTQVLEVWTQKCPYVTHLVIRGGIENEDIQLCTKFSCLKNLRITGIFYHFRVLVISPLIQACGEKLTEMDLKYLTINVEQITRLCKNLKRLFLFNVQFQDFNVRAIKSEVHTLNNLSYISIKHIDFSNEVDLKSVSTLLKSSIGLNELVIKYARNFPNDLAEVVLKLPHLTEVDFSISDITEETALKFFACNRMRKIGLDMCPKMPDWHHSKLKLLAADSPEINTLSWVIDYSPTRSHLSHKPTWSGEIYDVDD